MDFVDDVDFIFTGRRWDIGLFTKFADIVDTSIASSINLNNIYMLGRVAAVGLPDNAVR